MKVLKVPVAWFSEEPQEPKHKIFRKARVEHSWIHQISSTNDIMPCELKTFDQKS